MPRFRSTFAFVAILVFLAVYIWLAATLGDPAKLAAMRRAADTIRDKYLWRNAIRPLADVIRGSRVG